MLLGDDTPQQCVLAKSGEASQFKHTRWLYTQTPLKGVIEGSGSGMHYCTQAECGFSCQRLLSHGKLSAV